MNIPALIVACVTALALIAHVAIGTRESASIAPDPGKVTLSANWVQSMCAFQMLSVDLLAVSALLFAVALTDLGPAEPIVLRLTSLLFLLWGIVWIVQTRWLARPKAGLLRLPHWAVWLACAALLYWGS